jgi:hypothetical protein
MTARHKALIAPHRHRVGRVVVWISRYRALERCYIVRRDTLLPLPPGLCRMPNCETHRLGLRKLQNPAPLCGGASLAYYSVCRRRKFWEPGEPLEWLARSRRKVSIFPFGRLKTPLQD